MVCLLFRCDATEQNPDVSLSFCFSLFSLLCRSSAHSVLLFRCRASLPFYSIFISPKLLRCLTYATLTLCLDSGCWLGLRSARGGTNSDGNSEVDFGKLPKMIGKTERTREIANTGWVESAGKSTLTLSSRKNTKRKGDKHDGKTDTGLEMATQLSKRETSQTALGHKGNGILPNTWHATQFSLWCATRANSNKRRPGNRVKASRCKLTRLVQHDPVQPDMDFAIHTAFQY